MRTDNGTIHLGDVVVSKPNGIHSGVAQYDHGKAKAGQFERTDALAPPPAVLLSASQDLAVARAAKDPIEANIKRIKTRHKHFRRFKHPGITQDHLYSPTYVHLRPEQSCEECGCDPTQRIKWFQRPSDGVSET